MAASKVVAILGELRMMVMLPMMMMTTTIMMMTTIVMMTTTFNDYDGGNHDNHDICRWDG